MKRKRKYRKSNLTDEQKEQIALEYLTTDQSYREVGEKFGTTKLQVRHCCVWHERKELIAAVNNPDMPRLHTPQIDELNKQVKRLRRQLEMSQLKVEAFDTIIRLAEIEYKIDIRKKSGSRQRNS